MPDVLLSDSLAIAGSTGVVGPGTSSNDFSWATNMVAVVVPAFPDSVVTDGGTGFAVRVTPSGVPFVSPPGTVHSMEVVSTAIGDGAGISIPYLVVGNAYTASCYVQPDTGVNVVLSCPDATATVLDKGTLTDAWTTNGWVRVWVTFKANASTVALTVTSDVGTSNVDDVLVEIGSLIGTYFDGGDPSSDYGWEAGGTAGLTRSYFYENLLVSQQTIQDILTKHTPMGVIVLTPLYFVPPESHPSASPFVSMNQFQVFSPPVPVLIPPPAVAPPSTPGRSAPAQVPGYQTYAPGKMTLTQLAAKAGVTVAKLKTIDPGVVAKFGKSKVLPAGTGYWVPRHPK
jgi:hypothetical protein